MRLTVDADRCTGAGLCVNVAPEVLAMTADRTQAVVLVAEVPEDLQESARDAAEICPFAAIAIEQ